MDKHAIAQVFEEIGTLLELKGENPFKIRAYQNAARNLESSSEDLAKLAQEDKLQELPGIGKDLSEKIKELLKTGKLKYLEELRKEFPPQLPNLLKIPGLGPKKVKVLYEQLGIHSVGELEYACKENRLIDLKGFGEKTQNNILQGIQYSKKHQGTFLYDFASTTAQDILKTLLKVAGNSQASVGGSLRRHKETVHDIDLLVASKNKATALMKCFTQLPELEQILAQGETKSSIRLKSGIQVDLRVVSPTEYPYALIYFTGSKEHNTLLRGLAKDRGLKLNEYGLFKGTKLLPCKDEAAVYEALGLHYIPPEAREGNDEIDWASKKTFPKLIEEKDLKGIFHVHSTWSDGNASIETMAQKAQDLGFQYIGLSDHSQSAKYAGGLTEQDLIKQHAEIDRLNKKLKIKILKGIESDILADGSLDYPEKILKKFDFVIASVHSGFKMTESQMTERLIKALENPYTTMLGHLTGRLLLAREGYALDLDRILKTAVKHKKIIEINANPHRFDIDWRYLRKASQMGVEFSINPDAHSVEGLEDTFYGVGLARKGWLAKDKIFNTKSLSEVEKYLHKI